MRRGCVASAVAALLVVSGALSVQLIRPPSAEAATTGPGGYVALTPARILDTRNGTGAGRGAVAAGTELMLQVAGVGGVPATGVSAVVLNVTVTEPTAAGWVAVHPDGTTYPGVSNLNFSPAQTIPNLVVAKLGNNGRVDLRNGSGGTVQLVADVSGYFLAGAPASPGAMGALSPARILDTRDGTGAARGAVAANGVVALQVGGRGGVPASGVSAVVLNVTVTDSAAAGWVAAYADGASYPGVSNLNFSPGQTIPNLVVAPVGANGKVDLRNGSGGAVQLVADVSGYFLAGAPASPGAMGALSPARILDTRDGTGAARGAVAANGVVALQVDGRGGVPTSGVSAVVLNVTVTGPAAAGWIAAYADGASYPGVSNLNFSPGQTIANLVVAPVGANGKVDLRNGSGGAVQLVADVFGYFRAQDQPPPSSSPPATSKPAKFDSSFWTPYDDLTQPQMESALRAQKAVGENGVIIDWALDQDPGAMDVAYAGGQLAGYRQFNSFIDKLIAAARTVGGIPVYMGLIVAPDTFDSLISTPSGIASEVDLTARLADDLYQKFGSAIKGWYIPTEPLYNEVNSPAKAANYVSFLSGATNYLHHHDGNLPVMIAPYVPSAATAGASATAFVSALGRNGLFANSGIDIWNLQSGYGMTAWTPADEVAACQAAQAAVAGVGSSLLAPGYAHPAIWGDIYTPKRDTNGKLYPLMDFAPFMTAMGGLNIPLTQWEFPTYMNPDPTAPNASPGNYAAYQQYLAAGTQPTK
ncbi:MAG: DUF4434 domain-containing protein [Frankiaceae bacterium]|jgi:hypothetical protein|nr:DUF4434 domain-containing protein [Frankiaceae bacterium]